MKASGKRSAADKAAAKILARAIEPAWKLSADEAKAWREIMRAHPVEHWLSSDAALLTQYVTVLAMFQKARNDGDASAIEKLGRLALSYAVRLRLCPHSRIDARAAGRAAELGSDDIGEPAWLGPKAGPRDE